MPGGSRAYADEWLQKADEDLRSASLLLKHGGPPTTICFLSQQGAEKSLKGYLTVKGGPFRRVHDLLEILNACQHIDVDFKELEEDCLILNPYSVRVRYPGYPLECSEADAEEAVARSSHVREFIGSRLSARM